MVRWSNGNAQGLGSWALFIIISLGLLGYVNVPHFYLSFNPLP